jgi:hypothetical protein
MELGPSDEFIGGFMSITGILLAVAVIAVLYGFNRLGCGRIGVHLSHVGDERNLAGPSLRLIEEARAATLLASERHHVLFHLQSSHKDQEERGSNSHPLGISLDELEKCVPWVTGETNIVISSEDGFGASVLARLRSLHTKRELFLVRGAK